MNRFLLMTVFCFIGFGCGEEGAETSSEQDMSTSNNADTGTMMMPENDNGMADGDMAVNVDANPADAASPVAEDAATETDATAASDAMAEVDAATGVGGTGETCESALSLVDESVVDMASIRYTLNGSYADENNYNPYNGNADGLPPSCSPVYDAVGRDVVYALRLSPGETFRAWVAPPTEVRSTVGLYFIHDCATGTILDTDGSGACGNNEYSTQGNCSVFGGCLETHEWVYQYPEFVEGQPTDARTLYLVVDEIANDLGADFSIEWSVEDRQGNPRFAN
ncbi:MAG: hypothetical protein ACPGQS_11210 [Bradymonadia bacterium]